MGEEMKELSGQARRNGAFNAESSELSSQLKSLTPTLSSLEDLNLGETTTTADLSVTVVNNVDTSTVEFPPPTSATVQQHMEAMVSKKPPAKKKRKKTDPPDEEFLRRQQVARTVMDKHNITAMEITERRRWCAVCLQLTKDFYFNAEHGVSTKEDGVPHLTTNEIKFCPLADDHSIYYTYQTQIQEKKVMNNRRVYAESKGSS